MTIENVQSPESNRPGGCKARNLQAGAIKSAGDESAQDKYSLRPLESIPDRWLDVQQAAAYAGISEGFACRLMVSGELKSIKKGRLRRTKTSYVDSWLLSGGRA